jgi:tetratricopeptide (TPR) repeat protein
MATIPQALAIAVQFHQAGQLLAAEQICRQILAVEPNQPDAFHLLGVLDSQVRKHEIAVEFIGKAISLQGNVASFHNNLGEAYRALRRIPEAEACFRQALELKPDFAEAHNNLGNTLKGQGKLDLAVACYRWALELKPDYAEAHSNLGIALNESCLLISSPWRNTLSLTSRLTWPWTRFPRVAAPRRVTLSGWECRL